MGFLKEVPWMWFQNSIGESDDDQCSWQVFDCAEKGLMCGEAPAELLRPCGQSDQLQRFLVARSADCRGYQLFSNNGDALMNAVFSSIEPKVEFFLYNSREQDYDSAPAFTMTRDRDESTWLLVQEEQWGSCPNSPSSPLSPSTPSTRSTPGAPPRQLALFRHFCEELGGGLARCMEVSLPAHQEAPESPGRCAVRADLRRGRGVAQRLVTRLPEWDAARQALVLDFDSRQLQGSAKNFQLAREGSPREAVFQYGKIGASTFCLDFKAPLSIVQAFGASVSAAYWT